MPSLKQEFSQATEFPHQTLNYPLSFKIQDLTQVELISKITELVPGLIAVYNLNSGKYIFVNKSLTQILGYSPESFLSGGLAFVSSLIHPDDINTLMKENTQALAKANSKSFRQKDLSPLVTFEYRMKHKNGSWRWLHTTGVVFDRNKFGQVKHVMNISIDITKRRRAEIKEKKRRKEIEENLRQNEERFRALLEQSADAITLLDQTGKRIYATPSRKNILGYDTQNDFGQSVFDLVHPDDRPQVQTSFQKLSLEPSKTLTMVFRVRHKKGHWIWIEATGTNLFHIPQVAAIVVNYRDITRRKEAEDKNQFLEQASKILISSIDYETTLKNIANLIVPKLADYYRIVILDEEGQLKEVSLTHINPKKIRLVEKLYQNYKDKNQTTHGINKILQTGEAELIPQINSSILEAVKNDDKLLRIIDALGIKSYMGVPLKARGKIIGAMTFSSIRKDRFYNEDNLSFVQELAYRIALALDNAKLYSNEQNAVKLRDQFISVASHELKTPITSMKGFVQITQNFADNSKIKYFLSRIDEQVNRLTALTNNLLDVSRIQSGKLELNKESIILNDFLQQIIDDFEPLSKSHHLILQANKKIKIRADKYRLNQVLINLLTNGIKYSPQAREVIVSAVETKKNVQIKVEDFGIGIFSKNLQKIFEPFYQADTKVRQSYGGLGLGLHISQEIIKRHGGEILVESQKGQGSTFTIVLPKEAK